MLARAGRNHQLCRLIKPPSAHLVFINYITVLHKIYTEHYIIITKTVSDGAFVWFVAIIMLESEHKSLCYCLRFMIYAGTSWNSKLTLSSRDVLEVSRIFQHVSPSWVIRVKILFSWWSTSFPFNYFCLIFNNVISLLLTAGLTSALVKEDNCCFNLFTNKKYSRYLFSWSRLT